MKENDILHEVDGFWVSREKTGYMVWRPRVTHSVSDSAYPLTPDGLSLAKARVDYLARRAAT